MIRAVLTYLLTLGAALAVAVLALLQWRAPATTPEPSLINCFSYLSPTETNLFYPAMAILGGAICLITVFHRRVAARLCESMVLLLWGYLALVGLRTTSLGVASAGVPMALAQIALLGGAVFIASAFLLRRIPGGRT